MARGVHLPGWLYESLPYIYGASGVLAVFVLRGIAAFISGILLLSAGFIIWIMRRDYRRQAAARPARQADPEKLYGKSQPAPAGLVNLVWQKSFDVGHEIIDRQHRRLFSLGNEVINALIARQSKADIELLLSELVDEIAEHFRAEEEIMAGYDNPLSEEHKEIHSALLARVRELQRRFHHGTMTVGELVGFITYDVVAEHIMKEDFKFSPAIREAVATATT